MENGSLFIQVLFSFLYVESWLQLIYSLCSSIITTKAKKGAIFSISIFFSPLVVSLQI